MTAFWAGCPTCGGVTFESNTLILLPNRAQPEAATARPSSPAPPPPLPLNPGPASPSGPQNLDIEELTLAFKQGQGKSSRQSEKPGLGSWIHAGSTAGANKAEC